MGVAVWRIFISLREPPTLTMYSTVCAKINKKYPYLNLLSYITVQVTISVEILEYTRPSSIVKMV